MTRPITMTELCRVLRRVFLFKKDGRWWAHGNGDMASCEINAIEAENKPTEEKGSCLNSDASSASSATERPTSKNLSAGTTARSGATDPSAKAASASRAAGAGSATTKAADNDVRERLKRAEAPAPNTAPPDHPRKESDPCQTNDASADTTPTTIAERAATATGTTPPLRGTADAAPTDPPDHPLIPLIEPMYLLIASDPIGQIRALVRDRDEARDAALEEAAKMADNAWLPPLASRIRALKGKPCQP